MLKKLRVKLSKWRESRIEWVNLRKTFNRPEVKVFTFSYPILGQYIILSDEIWFSTARLETFLFYFGFLSISIMGLVFFAFCPFFFSRAQRP